MHLDIRGGAGTVYTNASAGESIDVSEVPGAVSSSMPNGAPRVVATIPASVDESEDITDQTLVIANGRMRDCGPSREVISEALLREVWGVEARIEPCSRGGRTLLIDGVSARAMAG